MIVSPLTLTYNVSTAYTPTRVRRLLEGWLFLKGRNFLGFCAPSGSYLLALEIGIFAEAVEEKTVSRLFIYTNDHSN